MITRRHLIGTLAAAALVGPASAEDRPNVLFIAVDDLVPALGCYGDPTAKTPEIDRLASQGITFLRHHTQWAVCGPSRAALTTGLMPEETNVIGFKKIRDKNFLPNVTTLPQHFRNNGYETACTGKFHDPRTVGTPTEISETYSDGVKDDGGSVDDPASWSVPYVPAAAGYSPATKVAVDATDQADALYSDFKILSEGISLLDDLAAPGGRAAGNKPFFLAVGFKKPHLPFVAPKAYWDLYDRNALPLPAFSGMPAGTTTYNTNTLLNNSELAGGGDDITNGYLPYSTDPALLNDPAQQRELIHGYYACVSFVDNLVGQLLAKLSTTEDPNQPGKKLSETTIVVLWGDHGFHLGDHGRWAKHTLMDRATSSPLIIFDPRSPRGASNNTTASVAGTTDIFPTLCELAGLPVCEQPADTAAYHGRPLRGRSLVSAMQDPSRSVHHGVISQFNINGQYGYAYRTGRFRLIEWVSASGNMSDGNARYDLFDYAVDPFETTNRAADPGYAAVVYQLSRSLRAEVAASGTGRLPLAAPVAAGGDAFLPYTQISMAGSDVTLDWPGSGGVSYDVVASATLANGSWENELTSLPGPSVTLPFLGSKRFYLIGIGTNIPPRFSADPLVQPLAVAGSPYSRSLAPSVSDPGDTVSFLKISGPAWLSVSTSGQLTGTPATSDAKDANYFVVEASDSSGCSARATVQITVADPSTNQAPAFSDDPVVKPDAVAGTAYAGTLLGSAADPDPAQTKGLVFSKVSGPDWLDVAPNGDLTGTPAAGDIGLVPCSVRVADLFGATDEAQLALRVNSPLSGTVQVITKTNAATSGVEYGTAFFPGVLVQAGDVVVVAHANNKNTSTNAISLTGLGANPVQGVSSGSSGTTSGAWIFHSAITTPGTFNLVLETSNTTKTVTQATTLFVLRASAGTLEVASTDGSVASAAPGVTALNLDLGLTPPSANAYAIAAGAVNASAFSGLPSGWTQELTSASKRLTSSNAAFDGAPASFASAASTDMALAGVVVQAVP